MTRAWKLGSIGSQEFKLSNDIKLTQLGVEFEVGRTLQLRPKQVVRGCVVCIIPENSRTLWVSNIKINFRGEETVTINSSSPTARTIFFDCNYTVWESKAEYLPWKEFYPGVYRYEFALKLPPVNFPPSVEGPKGFSIRYIWQPVIEGPGGPLDEGPEVVTPFIPIWFAPPDEEYQFAEFLDRPSINVEAILPKHVYSPGEELKCLLRLTNQSGGRITCVQCSLRKHYEGPLNNNNNNNHLIISEKHERSLVSTKRQCDVGGKTPGEFEFSLLIPKKFHYVPPTYKGNHLRVYYTIRCVIQWETRKLLPNIEFYEVIIPITMVSFPHIPQDKIEIDTSYLSHNESHLIPFFFDPCKDFPPNYPETDNNNNYPETNNSYPEADDNNYFPKTSSNYSCSDEEIYSRKTDQT